MTIFPRIYWKFEMFINPGVLNGSLRAQLCTCGIATFKSLNLLFESLSQEQIIDRNCYTQGIGSFL